MIPAIFSHMPAQLARHRRFCCVATARGFTLVEMLVAISITLVMMATVVGVFATVSNSVQNRRAAIEVGSQLRHVRNVLQRDLEGATCPTLPWTRPESNVGYFEIVEGFHTDFFPSDLTDGNGSPSDINAPEIDHAVSTLPSSNLPLPSAWVTDGGGLGDYDDILAFTSRNETEPFSGPAPLNNVDISNSNDQATFNQWGSQAIKSPVAEVVWFCVESPLPLSSDPDTQQILRNSFPEAQAGFRTIYRRTLLVAPWLDYRYNVDANGAKSRPGVLRIIDRPNVSEAQALAALIAFQERYDISARVEFDPTIAVPDGRWTIVANTLADLTKRENRFEHHGLSTATGQRQFPFTMMSAGAQPLPFVSKSVGFTFDPDAQGATTPNPTRATARPITTQSTTGPVLSYDIRDPGGDYAVRPLVTVNGNATGRAIVNEQGQVVYITKGLVPLGAGNTAETAIANRRGADLMMSDALGFDVQVYDPKAPVFAVRPNGAPVREGDTIDAQLDATTVGPSSLGWAAAAADSNNPLVVTLGSYVDLGYFNLHRNVQQRLGTPAASRFNLGQPLEVSSRNAVFSRLPNRKSQLRDDLLTSTYDTWSFHYENNGLNEDLAEESLTGATQVDEGTDGFDSLAMYDDTGTGWNDALNNMMVVQSSGVMPIQRLGPDDPGERETSPPYPVPLRAVQIKLRVYEPDSRQMREVTVRQHFVPE